DKTDKSYNKGSLNFGGQKAELWCQGGELSFIRQMIKESKHFQQQVLWFTCLVSKKDHVSKLKFSLKKANVAEIKIIKMAQGNKTSRFIAWRFS
ncbi:MAG: RlmF-related methyltransferase, partial [Colwellia sp.]